MQRASFSDLVHNYLLTSGHTQGELAFSIGLHPKVLSRKLNRSSNARLTEIEVELIINTLAEWHVLTTVGEAQKLLELAALKESTIDEILSRLKDHVQRSSSDEPSKPLVESISLLRIRITEEPLTAQNLMVIISALTDLHTKCWLIQQSRFADLMDYAQTRNIHFSKEANLRITQMAYNSPALIDFLVSSASIAGTATLALALKTAIDAVLQAPLRFRATQLQNQKEALEQKIREQEAQQTQQIADQKAQVDLERQTMLLDLSKKQIEVENQQLELDKQRLELEKKRVKVVLEIATTMVSQLQPDTNTAMREMLARSLVPSLLQLATTDGLELALPSSQKSEKQGSQTENK